ncbi:MULTISPECIES: DUF6612 family protein [Halobacterium]|uniref:DUF6612 family protein n=1 Tax=Halobacterium TaxID=2239 RepID=UPI00073E5C00|nr:MULTISPECIES: DUF6612 family protein [Halobacterium]MCG1003458.1 hypothetical protein [Halobacterium noricense]
MRRRVLLSVCVAALLVTAGCTGLSSDDTADTPQIQSDVVDAMADVDTYRMEMRMNISANGQTLSMTQRGVFDHEAEQARVNASALGRQTTTYIDGTTAYVNVGGVWQTRDFSDREPWNESTGIDRQRALLESGSVTVAGSATVDGVATTVLRVDPKPSDVKSVIAQQGQGLDEVGIESATYRMYVANDTHRLRQVEMDLEMSINDQTTDANATMTFSAYGEPVNISVPDAATTQAARGSVAA